MPNVVTEGFANTTEPGPSVPAAQIVRTQIPPPVPTGQTNRDVVRGEVAKANYKSILLVGVALVAIGFFLTRNR